jgi:O-methyltransferase/methyltransferase family protein
MSTTIAAATTPPALATAANPGRDRIMELAYGFRAAKVLLSAVELDVFTILAEGGCDLDSLKEKIGISDRGARDFFDALVALRLIERDASGRYRNTAGSEVYLDRRKSSYIGGELDYVNARAYPHWHHLTTALKTGEPQSEASHASYFPTLYLDQAKLELFTQGMATGATSAGQAIAARFPWQQYKTLVDVGAAQGSLLVQIAQAHPHLNGSGLDLPTMQPLFDRHVHDHGLGHRFRFHAADFLQDPLPSADVLVFGRVLHNWNLAAKKQLLGKAYDALPTGGAIIVFERLIDDERRRNASGLLASLHMLIMTEGGFDFSAVECMGWMRDTGFRDLRVESLTGAHSMVVGMK